MKMGYTESALDNYLSMFDKDTDAIWDGIKSMPDDSEPEKWKKKIESIASEYVLSSRFALMRIFQRREVSKEEIDRDSSTGFEVKLDDGTTVEFKDISIEHAANMEKSELKKYEKLLMDKAKRSQGTNSESECKNLIDKALQYRQRNTKLLTKEEAMTLGHVIDLTLDEMNWFLLRVFNVDGRFRYNSSSDLIDVYVFLRTESGKGGKSSEELKSEYNSKYGKVTKIPHDDKLNWTESNEDFLDKKVKVWSPDDCDVKFMEWMGERAEHLDLPSQTALRVFRNLAVYTYDIICHPTRGTPDVDTIRHNNLAPTEFEQKIGDIVSYNGYMPRTIEALFEDGLISDDKCKTVADGLMKEMQDLEFSDNTDLTRAMHTIDTKKNGKITVNGELWESRTRIHDLLFEKPTIGKNEDNNPIYGTDIQVEKSDMLILLWLTSNLCWTGAEKPSPCECGNRLYAFIDTAYKCLEKSRLPAFYPAHLVEQSMMLSIVYAYTGPEGRDPAEVYERICDSVIEHKKDKEEE
ncbi:MAG: hypothetical protein LUF29_03065 [Oscillospiraceae bacterium]|nr:hypothetical protein [Oscillospiraceae bacterium]